MPRTVIVTGAARGIGKAIALRLATDGFDVCINDIAVNKEQVDEVVHKIEALGRKSIGVIADVSKRSEVDQMIQTSCSALGDLHVFVANAGIAQVKPLLEVTEEDNQKMFDVNYFGVHNCYAAAATQMIKQGPAKPGDQAKPEERAGVYKIIGAASIVAHKPFPLLGHYSASKWAVRGLTQVFAMEMAQHGITVNSYAPGIVGTQMWDLIDEKIGDMRGARKGETITKYSNELIALKRTSVPEDVSSAVHYLASPDSDYMTGQCMVIDGGVVFT